MERTTLLLSRLLLTFCVLTATCLAQEKEKPKPVTTGNVKIDVLDLRVQLKPLTQAELVVEVEGWRDLLKAKVQEIGTIYIQSRDAEANQKTSLLDQVSNLEGERANLIERTRAAMSALETKGGDIKLYDKYVRAVSSTDVDVTDASALWTMTLNWLKSEAGGWLWGKNLLLFIVTLLAFRILASILGRITRKAVTRVNGASVLLQDFFVKAVGKVTFFVGLVVALSFLGIEIGPFLAAMGAAGFIIGFALQGTLSNFAAGILILLYRPYDVGHSVTVSGTSGKVEAMSLVSTTLRTPDNQKVVIPNNSIWGNIITNVTGSATRRVDLTFGIGYSDDIDKAMAIIGDVIDNDERVLGDPAPNIRVGALADSSVNIIARPWTKTSDYWDVYWDMTKAVKERFDAEGISIPFPQRDVHLHQVAAS